MSSVDRLLENSRAYAAGFAKGDLAAPPAKRVAVLACMDARLDPARLLGLEEGDAHVVRNAGGAVTDDAIRSLAISQHLLGTEEIVLIQHTHCGMQGASEDEMAEALERASGERPPWPLHAFEDLETNLRESLRTLRESPFILDSATVRGFVYDVKTGELREVQ
ncbi:MAG TPA: carbonic anhydrase [Thermoleophilaceae bacterium]|jgi:carbonic anhydrase